MQIERSACFHLVATFSEYGLAATATSTPVPDPISVVLRIVASSSAWVAFAQNKPERHTENIVVKTCFACLCACHSQNAITWPKTLIRWNKTASMTSVGMSLTSDTPHVTPSNPKPASTLKTSHRINVRERALLM